MNALLDRSRAYQVVAVTADGHATLEAIREHEPDLVLLDTQLLHLSGPDVAERASKEGGSACFLFLTDRNDADTVEAAFAAGASGYVCKGDSTSELLKAIDRVCAGGTYVSPTIAGQLVRLAVDRDCEPARCPGLTSREREVLQLVAEGLSSKEIAKTLHLSVRTVDTHRGSIMEKLDIHNVPGLVRYAIRTGLLSP